MSNKPKVVYGTLDNIDVFTEWKTERERIKMNSIKYKKKNIVEAFTDFYGADVINSNLDKKSIKSISTFNILEVGKVYHGTVKCINKDGIEFDVLGVKESVRSTENFSDCIDSINRYLEKHHNQLFFEVREIKKNEINVSVANGYYKRWVEHLDVVRNNGDAIKVHIDSLTQGGYLCHCIIPELCELTNKEYTSSVFIPGSQIVLNIEKNFEKWVGEEVLVVPKNFVQFRPVDINGRQFTENSLVGSRKEVLQILGMQNLYQLWITYALAQKDNVSWTPEVLDGVVTGIICSNKNQGVFVELDGKYITGLLPTQKYIKYKQGDPIKVKIKAFETQEGKRAFEANKKGRLVKSNTRVVFELA